MSSDKPKQPFVAMFPLCFRCIPLMSATILASLMMIFASLWIFLTSPFRFGKEDLLFRTMVPFYALYGLVMGVWLMVTLVKYGCRKRGFVFWPQKYGTNFFILTTILLLTYNFYYTTIDPYFTIFMFVALLFLAWVRYLVHFLFKFQNELEKFNKQPPTGVTTVATNVPFVPAQTSMPSSSSGLSRAAFVDPNPALPSYTALYPSLDAISITNDSYDYGSSLGMTHEDVIVRSAWFSTNKTDQETPNLVCQKKAIKATVKTSKRVTDIPKSAEFIKIQKRCLKEKQLFEDKEFPPSKARASAELDVEWKRPHEIHSTPHFFTDGHFRFDVCQGELGDCWFLAGVATITLCDLLFDRVIPPDQSFSRKHGYCGMFRFHFWRYGEWVEVIIDDRLPCRDGKLILMHSTAKNEFWGALLEKAYAKFYGSYDALEGGWSCEALEDMTGGLTEFINLKKMPQNFLEIIVNGLRMSSLFSCALFKDMDYVGLVKGHAYSITGVCKFNIQSLYGPLILLRIRNPWGRTEWKGRFSDSSTSWNIVPKQVRDQIHLSFDDDGEFWMEYGDFIQNFESVDICHLGPDVMKQVHGSEITTLGRTQWYSGTFHVSNTAESYKFSLKTPDGRPSTLIVAVMVKGLREKGLDMTKIGFTLFKVGSKNPLMNAKTPDHVPLREIVKNVVVPSGDYIVTPRCGAHAELMIRVYSASLISSSQGVVSQVEPAEGRCNFDLNGGTCNVGYQRVQVV